jgi:membrane-associated phospholipid phosphatase
MRDFGSTLWDGTRLTLSAPARWDEGDWITFGLESVAVAGTALALDRAVDRAVKRNYKTSVDNALKAIEPFGKDYSFGVLGVFYINGALTDDSNAKQVAGDGLAASLVASGIISPVLKLSTGRSRPNDEKGVFDFKPFGGHKSLPSGHATQAFAIGSVIASHYEQRWIDVISYGMASAVGLARVYHRQHFLSDVVVGAFIGTGVGKMVVHINREMDRAVTVTPIIAEDFYGLAVGSVF